jgi:hypothetical protein
MSKAIGGVNSMKKGRAEIPQRGLQFDNSKPLMESDDIFKCISCWLNSLYFCVMIGVSPKREPGPNK